MGWAGIQSKCRGTGAEASEVSGLGALGRAPRLRALRRGAPATTVHIRQLGVGLVDLVCLFPPCLAMPCRDFNPSLPSKTTPRC